MSWEDPVAAHHPEWPAPTLPGRAWFEYRGKRYDVERASNADIYQLVCPGCGDEMSFVHKPGGNHDIRVADNGAITSTPSLVCPHRKPYPDGPRCGWHVWITDGQAKDC